jgi:hypothetical protein
MTRVSSEPRITFPVGIISHLAWAALLLFFVPLGAARLTCAQLCCVKWARNVKP